MTPKRCLPKEGFLWGPQGSWGWAGAETPVHLLCGNMRWSGYAGATFFCVITSVHLQQLQLVAGRKTRIPMAKATSAPGVAYLGSCCPGMAPCISASGKGSPKAGGPSGMPESPVEEGLVPASSCCSAYWSSWLRGPLLLLFGHRNTVWSKTTCLFF